MTEQLKQQFTIERMQPEDLEAVTEMRLQTWLDTYPNVEAGVTREWVEARNEEQRSPEAMERRLNLMEQFGTGWVAKSNGEIIGATTPYKDQYGIQHVGSLYVAKEFHGSGAGSALMEKVIEWSDSSQSLVLSVVSYNDRVKAFYQKYGFLEVEGSDSLFDGVVPEVDIVRPDDKQRYKNLNPKFEIKDSLVAGRGLFTKTPIKKGESIQVNINPQPIEEYEFNDEEFEKFREDCTKNGLERDSVSIGDGRHRAAVSDRDQHPENFGNHSCDPNLDSHHVALRDIKPGEELTADYALFSDINWTMKCHCGSKNCKGIIRGKVE